MMRYWSRSLVPAFLALLLPALSLAQISIDVSVNTPPPELPVYDQPPVPADGYVWTPGYWAWGDDLQDYYWVPGTWVPAPEPDYLWTPGYWGTDGAAFLWHAGYWGPQVGFYGGVNYGYGYGGNGYEGGYWQGGHLYYNRSVNNIGNSRVTNVYNKTVVDNVAVNRVSYNGGNGVHAVPNAAQMAASRERHIPATSLQLQHVQMARGNPSLRASANGGHPQIAATPRSGVFSGAGVVGARNAPSSPPAHPSENAPQPPAAQQRAPGAPQPQGEHPPVEQHRASQPQQQPHVTPQAHPSAPRPAEHPAEHQEHEEDHERH